MRLYKAVLIGLLASSPSWAQQYPGAGPAALVKANNLSDLASVAAARINLFIDGRTTVGNESCAAAFTWNGGQTNIVFNTALTAPQNCALPAAAGVNAGFAINFKDAGAVNGSNIVTIARAGSDTIDGATSLALSVPYGDICLRSNGATGWDVCNNMQLAAYTAPAHQWIDALSAAGVFSATQPAFTDISGTAAAAQLPLATASAVGGIEGDGATIALASGIASVNPTTINGQTCTPGSSCNTNTMWGASCATLATTATTEYCATIGGTTAASASTSNIQLAGQNATFTAMYVVVTSAPGASDSHTFTLLANGSATAITCTISGASATTCSDTAHTATVAAGQNLQVTDVTVGTPAASAAHFGFGFHVTN